MSENDPDTNGGLPPKISLKPKTSTPTPENAINTGNKELATAKADTAERPKPISLEKTAPAEPTQPTVPNPPSGPKPITLKKPVAQNVSAPKPSPPAPPKSAQDSAPKSVADLALEEAKHEEADLREAKNNTPPPPEPSEEEEVPTAVTTKMAAPPVSPKTPTLKPDDNEKAIPLPTTQDADNKPAATTKVPDPDTEKATASKPIDANTSPTTEEKGLQEEAKPVLATSPKRPILRPAGSGPTTIKRPAPVGIRKDASDPLAVPGTKKSTSRISLPSNAEKSTSGQIRTIKIAPKSQAGKADIQPHDTDTEDDKKPAVDPKRQTSRISLESVLGGESKSPNAPATIKIKRAAPEATSASQAKTIVKSPGSNVSQEEPATDETQETNPESQKKTLKIKRPSVPTSGKPAASDAPSIFTPPVPTGKTGEPEPHWAFSIIAIAATLVVGVLIYVLTAQIMDVDLSEAPPQDGLPWPARYSQ